VASIDEPVEWTAHYANGRIKYTGFRLNGEMHGVWSFYRTDGSLMRSGRHRHRRPDPRERSTVGLYLLAVAMVGMFISKIWNAWVLIAEVSE